MPRRAFSTRLIFDRWQPIRSAASSGVLPASSLSLIRTVARLREFLAGVGSGELYLCAAELVLSELVANAVLHGGPGGGQFGELLFVRLELRAELLVIEVHDASARTPTVRDATACEESGRGLYLVEQLAVDWGSRPRDGIGKSVWARIGPSAHCGAV
ncbi:ATP-binding protein [Kitasatospora sp. NPDC006697]|uniref:ATP-binding protein n=1 Tax=Kitasatospora sp. NPDC006697 TaxID=3364020 RepID=UPI00367B25D5